MNNRDIPFLVITALILLATGIRLTHLQNQVRSRVAPEETETEVSTEPTPLPEDAELFRTLLEENLIRPVTADNRLDVVMPDAALVRRAAIEQMPDPSEAALEEADRLERHVKTLYHTPPGNAVLGQVRLWNETRRLAAVRDNRPANSQEPPNLWRAVEPENSEWRHARTHGRVPESFGYVTRGMLLPGFSDWLAAFSIDAPVDFTTTVALENAASLMIQVIGRPDMAHTAPRPDKITPCCPPGLKTCTQKDADAFILQYAFRAGNHPIKLRVTPAVNAERRVGGINIEKTDTPPGFVWRRTPPTIVAGDRRSIRILTADGTALTDSSGKPTAACKELGLAPLTGFGDSTPFSLWGMLARAWFPPETTRVRLTIDADLQTAALKALENRISTLFGNDDYARFRRGAVVILDADTGAILAAATHPQPPDGVHPWDLAAFARVYPVDNPMLMRGWQGLDEHFTPGSTFKPVVALAAMDASVADPGLADYLRGFSQSTFAARSGLALDCASYDPLKETCSKPGDAQAKTIDNFEGIPVGRAFAKNPADKWPARLGLRQAVRDSINVWFVRLGLLLDGNAAHTFDGAMESLQKGMRPPDRPDFQLVRTARKLGFGEPPPDLAAGAPEGVRLPRRPPATGREGDMLFGHPGKLDLMNPKATPLTWVLAQNAIGQGVTASPLQMAKVAAAIRNGAVRQPVLIAEWGADPARWPTPEPLGLDETLLSELRTGMGAVPVTGTAASAFGKHPDQRRIFGKTGTANVATAQGGRLIRQKRFFTTWFTGWYEPAQNGRRPLAFACMITHAHGEKHTGGAVAAPVMAEILQAMNASEGAP